MIAAHNPPIEKTISLPHRIIFPVLRGPLAGMWWSAAGGWRVASFATKQQLDLCHGIAERVRSGSIVLDIGSGTGMFAALFAKLVTTTGAVLAVEQNPHRAKLLEYHGSINGMSQLSVSASSIGAASDVRHGYADFTIDELVQMRGINPTHIRLSVSREQFPALQSAEETIRAHRPVLFLTTRTENDRHHCCKWLAELGYELRPLVGKNVSEASELVCTPQPKPLFLAA